MKNTVVVNTRNRMLSQNLMMTLDTRHTELNNNIFIVGGPGSGKTYRFVMPNLMQMFGAYIITDPKGEIMRGSAGFMKHFGYQVKVLNLLHADGMRKSTRYNPFRYITSDTDIIKLVNTFMAATACKKDQGGDQYWTDMAGVVLQAIFHYVNDIGVELDGRVHRDFRAVMHLVNMLRIEEDPRTGARKDTELDVIFNQLKRRQPNHPAVLAYNKTMVGAADTVRSIISVVHSRTARLQTEELLELLSDDEMDIKTIGARKTAVYCIIPDNDDTFNFVVSMLYQQMIQQMYYQADFVYGGTLPIHVTFMLDEYYNVSLPDEFCAWLTTMRSRGLSAIIIVQTMAQIKDRHKDVWETIPASCDTFLYLGNNEQSTHDYISKLLDKATIDKQTQGQTRGKQGSSSTNEDVLGRELMLPGEVRRMSRKKCLIIISGKDPVLDDKIKTNRLPLWAEFNRMSKDYRFDGRLERHNRDNTVTVSLEGGTMGTVRLLDQVEQQLMKEERKRACDDYEEEVRVARLLGNEEPLMPEIAMSLTLQELSDYVAALETEETAFPDGEQLADLEYQVAQNASTLFRESAESTSEIPEKSSATVAVLEQYAEGEPLREEGSEERGEKNTMKVEREEPQEKLQQSLQIVMKLIDRGYSMEQIQLLRPVLLLLPLDQLTTLFDPGMSTDMIKVVLDILGH